MSIDADALGALRLARAEAERDAMAAMLADCVAVLEQVPVALLPGRVDMMLMSALDAPMHDVAATRTELITRAKAIRSKISEETARAGEWQPIETAPKDGTHVDIARIGVEPIRAWHQYGRWWVYGCGPYAHPADFTAQNTPTHWRPLPALPLTEEAVQ